MRQARFCAVSVDEAKSKAPWASAIYQTGSDYHAETTTGVDADGSPINEEGYDFHAFESHVDAQSWLNGFEPGEYPERVR